MDAIELPETEPPKRPSPGDGLRDARGCYEHIAGRLGTDRGDKKWIVRRRDKRQLRMTETGRAGFADVFGIER